MDLMNVSAKFEVRSFTRSWDNSGYLKKTWGSPWICRSRSPNRKRVYDFLLVGNSNLGPVLHRFGDIAGFFALPSDPTPIPPQFWVWCRCTRRPMLGSAGEETLRYSAVKLFSKNSNLCDHGTLTLQTERQTDGRTIYDRNIALCTKVHRAVITIIIIIVLFRTFVLIWGVCFATNSKFCSSSSTPGQCHQCKYLPVHCNDCTRRI